jgi:hypothetical protein
MCWPTTSAGLSSRLPTGTLNCVLLAIGYLAYGHGNSIMLVHSATAPNAVLRTLP